MKLCFIIAIHLLVISVCQVTSSNLGKKPCNCGGLGSGGVDMCNCESTVIRPPLPQKLIFPVKQEIGLDFKLEELEKKYIHPVLKAKPSPCRHQGSPHHIESEEILYPYHHYKHKPEYQKKYLSSYEKYDFESEEEDDDDYYYINDKIPADAVSLALAYDLARRKGQAIKEDGLIFGHKTIPLEETIVKSRVEIPEHKLHGITRKVVELKLPGLEEALALEEEAEEALLKAKEEEEEFRKESLFTNYLTYADLGYVPETSKCDQKFAIRRKEEYPHEKIIYLKPKPKPWIKEGHIFLGKDKSEEEYYSREDTHYSSEEYKDKYPHHGFKKLHETCGHKKHYGYGEK